MDNKTFSITFGDRAENNIGMQMLGNLAEKGINKQDLDNTIKYLNDKKINYQIIELHNNLPVESKENYNKNNELNAYLLVIPNGVNKILEDNNAANLMLQEQFKLPFDKKALMRGRVVNKLARWNSCFDEVGQEPDIENGKGTVISFDNAPLLNKLRLKLPTIFGPKTNNLKAEMNYYYDTTKCGIGFHGDAERRIVICARLGSSIPMHFQWFHRFKPIGERFATTFNHGDIYIMSEKTVGTDWKKSSIPTLRHAAGCDKYTTIK